MLEALYTAAEMRAAEERYAGYPESIPELMERAGTAVARETMLAFPAARQFACVCGGGSNGGDGRVAARVLRDAGHTVDETGEVEGADVIVDALFGTGFRGEPRADAAAAIERINAAAAPVVSVDLPSGVDASTGEVAGAVVDADLTVTFHAPKVGLAVAPGRFRAGRVVLADIGLDDVDTEHRRATPALLDVVPRRAPGDTKYTAGSVLVVGGQPGMTGAVASLRVRPSARTPDTSRSPSLPSRFRSSRRSFSSRSRSAGPMPTASRRSSQRRIARVRSRSARGWGAAPRGKRSFASSWSGSTSLRSSTRTRCSTSNRSGAKLRQCSLLMRESSRVSSERARSGSTRTGWRPHSAAPTASPRCSSSRAPTRSSQRQGAG